MAKSNNREDSGDKGRSGRSREDRPGRRGAAKADDDKKKKDGYKAKRSFSKNKIFREIKETRGDRPRRPFDSEGRKPFRKPFGKDQAGGDKPSRLSEGGKEREYKGKTEGAYGDKKPFKRSFEKPRDREEKPREPRSRESRDEKPSERKFAARDEKPGKSFKKPYKPDDKFGGFKKANSGFSERESAPSSGKKKRFSKPRKNDETEGTRRVKYEEFEEGKAFTQPNKEEIRVPKKAAKPQGGDELIRLNKYLSNAGVASRRDADNLIQSGVVKVNGVVVDQLGYKIKAGDKVTYGDAAVRAERKVYLLLNKPKDYITTVDDPRERKTVMELISGACRERIYPVGRLDRNTTGLLLFTNDGELTTKLTHPKFGVKKVYHVSLNKGLKPDDFKAITEGVELEDGYVKADDLAFVGEGKKEVGIEIHSGRNRIVRRLFEHLGYDVLKLDRVVFAGLTKKDLPRGKHRFLTAKEISFLQMIG